MPERKAWNHEQDRILKFLKEQKKQVKWSVIARKMEEQYMMPGRTGKQCRERYHNHLDSNIINSEWTKQEEQILFQLHEEIGNKWAVISNKLPGRTDNCVKNHFYSKLRKAVRKINKIIYKSLKKEFKEIKTTTLYKIIEGMDAKFRLSTEFQKQESALCTSIKNRLVKYQDDFYHFETEKEQLEFARLLIIDITHFSAQIKKIPKKVRKASEQGSSLLHPNRCLIRHSNSYQQENESSERASEGYQSSVNSLSFDNDEQDVKSSGVSEQLQPHGKNSLHRTKSNSSIFSTQSLSSKKKIVQQKVTKSMTLIPISTHMFQDEVQDEGKEEQKIQIEEQQNLQRQMDKSESSARMSDGREKTLDIFYEDSKFIMRVFSPKMTTEERLEFSDGLFLIPMDVEENQQNEMQDEQIEKQYFNH